MPASFDGTPVFLGCSDVDAHIPLERVHESAEVFRRMGAAVDERIYPRMGHTVNSDELDGGAGDAVGPALTLGQLSDGYWPPVSIYQLFAGPHPRELAWGPTPHAKIRPPAGCCSRAGISCEPADAPRDSPRTAPRP